MKGLIHFLRSQGDDAERLLTKIFGGKLDDDMVSYGLSGLDKQKKARQVTDPLFGRPGPDDYEPGMFRFRKSGDPRSGGLLGIGGAAERGSERIGEGLEWAHKNPDILKAAGIGAGVGGLGGIVAGSEGAPFENEMDFASDVLPDYLRKILGDL